MANGTGKQARHHLFAGESKRTHEAVTPADAGGQPSGLMAPSVGGARSDRHSAAAGACRTIRRSHA